MNAEPIAGIAIAAAGPLEQLLDTLILARHIAPFLLELILQPSEKVTGPVGSAA
jgi:hypothetical protein